MTSRTFSITGRCPQTGDMGVAVASRYLAVGAVVPFAQEGLAAIATQCWHSPRLAQHILGFLRNGLSPQQALERVLADDENSKKRQMAIIDAQGRKAAHTGIWIPTDPAHIYAGHIVGENFIAAGNTLTGSEVLDAMERQFVSAENRGFTLAWRLLSALKAGEEQGGDHRGKQAAAILVVAGQKSESSAIHKVNSRVDDHSEPIDELMRIYNLTLVN